MYSIEKIKKRRNFFVCDREILMEYSPQKLNIVTCLKWELITSIEAMLRYNKSEVNHHTCRKQRK